MNMDLRDKTILVVSPQSWGKMFISKHHYAIELARRGNKVLFLNPPENELVNGQNGIAIVPSGVTDNLFLVHHRLSFPYRLKFHALPLFHWLMQFHVRKLLKEIGPVDIVWSFDLGNLYPFRLLGNKAFKVFHPVDEPLNKTAIEAARDADIIFSVTQEILEKYKTFQAPKHFINHGVSDDFLQGVNQHKMLTSSVRVGFAGNLLRGDIDREILLKIMRENPTVIFECWGSYARAQSNIGGGEDAATRDFITSLRELKNVILHGPVPSAVLAKAVHDMDAFLICYDVQKDQSKGTNYHKILEYLSTGKVVISNNVTTYQHDPLLIAMTQERLHNRDLPGLFRNIIDNLHQYNSMDKQEYRIAFARDNTYTRQIERIEKILYAK
jgi:glycosyltransferase involved in cell wall biosynthesis